MIHYQVGKLETEQNMNFYSMYSAALFTFFFGLVSAVCQQKNTLLRFLFLLINHAGVCLKKCLNLILEN
jgi:hypothetical protein